MIENGPGGNKSEEDKDSEKTVPAITPTQHRVESATAGEHTAAEAKAAAANHRAVYGSGDRERTDLD